VFITCVTFERTHIFSEEKACKILNRVWIKVSRRHPFTTEAICVLPDHIHTLLTLPENDTNYSLRIREIKRLFTIQYLAVFGEFYQRNTSRTHKKEATVWQRRFWEHTIRDEQDYENHFDYIHYNPVKHGLVNNVADWSWSSFHRYVKAGVYAPDWGEGDINISDATQYGE
jgi:putative transposase